MSQPELLKRVVEVLDEAGIGYLVTGSLASGLQGEARATHDVSGPDYYLNREAVLEAIRQKSMFNLLSLREGDKVDSRFPAPKTRSLPSSAVQSWPAAAKSSSWMPCGFTRSKLKSSI